jgi:hypothetical protein
VTHLLGAAIALLCIVPTAAASLDRPKPDVRPAGIRLSRVKPISPEGTRVPPPAEVQVTSDTEVYLDGRPCKYNDVPAGASVASMVLAPDRKTLLRIDFHSPK